MHVLGMTVVRQQGCTGGVWYRGRVYRVGTGEGNTGTQPTRLREVPGQRSGPRKPCKGWSGWSWGRNTLRGQDPPLRGPVGTPAGSLPGPSQYAASWPIRARFGSYLSKVSQNGQVSPKNVHKASRSPCFQNGPQKSPLDISRFYYLASLLSQGINGPILAGSWTLLSK